MKLIFTFSFTKCIYHDLRKCSVKLTNEFHEFKNILYICIVKVLKAIIPLIALCLFPDTGSAISVVQRDSLTLRTIMEYRQKMGNKTDTIETNVYSRYFIKTQKRNFTLMAVPSMYAISRGRREYAGEIFRSVKIVDNNVVSSIRHLDIGTIPHHREAMPTLWKYVQPDIYDITIFDNQILSPLNSYNRKLYKYEITYLTNHRAEIVFHPKRYNTQLISGAAIVDRETGRVIRMRCRGEYDMVRFNIDILMGSEGALSLLPKECDMDAVFHFMGNKLNVHYKTNYGVEASFPDAMTNQRDTVLMKEIRPQPLPAHFKRIYSEYDSLRVDAASRRDSTEEKNWNKMLWDVFGDYLINRSKGNFGSNAQGAFRISPILNPLYLSYSGHRGITYKLKVRGSYAFSVNTDISLSLKTGYSFKQKQLYYQIPLRFTFNNKRDGYIEVEIGNGNRITTSDIVKQVKNENPNHIDWDKMNLDYFKDFYMKSNVHYDITDKWGIMPGFIYHRRSAVDPRGFEIADRPTKYFSFAPALQLQYRPLGKKDLVITTDYERGIKVGNADMDYERFEFDLSLKKQYHSLRSLSMKFGGGFYTSKSNNSYFLDYTNFRDVNIPGGWNDDWTGEFQLLNSNWYNASKYYIRSNVTYEAPLMILSRIPYIGKMMEIERIYINILSAEHLHPYIECGYGFTNRFFTTGIFTAISNKKFEGVGFRFGFELFRDW